MAALRSSRCSLIQMLDQRSVDVAVRCVPWIARAEAPAATDGWGMLLLGSIHMKCLLFFLRIMYMHAYGDLASSFLSSPLWCMLHIVTCLQQGCSNGCVLLTNDLSLQLFQLLRAPKASDTIQRTARTFSCLDTIQRTARIFPLASHGCCWHGAILL